MKPKDDRTPEQWTRDLVDKLINFKLEWIHFKGTELEGAQDFLRDLLSLYEGTFKPGTIFEQHPIKIAKPGTKASQGQLFSPQVMGFTTERMDMYLPKLCIWEMKSPTEKDLQKHHAQILGYWSRMRTRYMVLCNFREFWIYDTADENGQLAPKLKFTLEELPSFGDALLFLRGEQADLEDRRAIEITAAVAGILGRLERKLIDRTKRSGGEREGVARFVLACVFAMFAEDTDLIPESSFTRAVGQARDVANLAPVRRLFDDLSRSDPTRRDNPELPYVNGSLFDLELPAIELSTEDLDDLYAAAKNHDWQAVRPEVFGSIFEQSFSATMRHELGAHFTREEDILKVVGPTIIEPWRQRMDAARTPKDLAKIVEDLKAFHVLDPACGSGNFLYVVYRELKRIEVALKVLWPEVQRGHAKRRKDIEPVPPGPYFTIQQLHGIEIDRSAAFLARVVLWIGEYLAKRELALDEETLPLKSLVDNIVCGDALKVDWPRPAGELAIVGNPPYLGVRRMRSSLGDAYVEDLFERFPDNRAADLVTYWFPRALETLRPGERAGFVCTNSIAQNESREATIDKILAKGGTIVDAWHSLIWPGDAAVHFSIVNWIMAPYDGIKTLDGKEVLSISPRLTHQPDVSKAKPILRNKGLCFMGVTPGNEGFVLDEAQREEIVAADPKSAEVIRPYLIGRDVNREIDQGPSRWIIDFGTMEKEEAEDFKGAMRHLRKHVYPVRKNNRRESYAQNWWLFVEARSGLREALDGIKQVLVLPAVTAHLIVSRQPTNICFDHKLYVVCVHDAYHFGILHSKLHDAWAWARGATLKADLSYTNTTVFATFPFPRTAQQNYDPRERPKGAKYDRVADAAKVFDELRSRLCKERQLGLTKIHNLLEAGELPELTVAYEALNDAVCAAYGWPEATWRDEADTLQRLLKLNLEVAPMRPLGAV